MAIATITEVTAVPTAVLTEELNAACARLIGKSTISVMSGPA
jgi:hypothetical protein